jgi:hypothetical protein
MNQEPRDAAGVRFVQVKVFGEDPIYLKLAQEELDKLRTAHQKGIFITVTTIEGDGYAFNPTIVKRITDRAYDPHHTKKESHAK